MKQPAETEKVGVDNVLRLDSHSFKWTNVEVVTNRSVLPHDYFYYRARWLWGFEWWGVHVRSKDSSLAQERKKERIHNQINIREWLTEDKLNGASLWNERKGDDSSEGRKRWLMGFVQKDVCEYWRERHFQKLEKSFFEFRHEYCSTTVVKNVGCWALMMEWARSLVVWGWYAVYW